MAFETRTRKIEGLDVIEVPGDREGGGVLCFHGFGADANDLIALSQIYRIRPRPTWFFPNAPLEIPIAPNYYGRAWFEIDMGKIREAVQIGKEPDLDHVFPQDISEIRTRIERLILDLAIPTSKLFLAGFSQGAVLALDAAFHGFESFAGLLIFSGTLIYGPSWEKLAPQHAGMPFFQSHGERDPLLPFSRAKALESLLIQAGLKGQLTAFNGGHEIPQSVQLALNRFLTQHLAPK